MGQDDRSSESDSAANRGTEHLQAAGRELIAAARAFLDVAEEAIEDSQVVEEAGAMVRDVMHRLGVNPDTVDLRARGSDRGSTGAAGTRSGDAPGSSEGPSGDGTAGEGPPGERSAKKRERPSRVRRIDVE